MRIIQLLPVLDLLDTDFVVDQLVYVCDDDWALDVHEGERRRWCAVVSTCPRPRRRPWVDKELVVVFDGLEYMGMPRNQHVHVHLPRNSTQRVKVASGDTLVAMYHSNLDGRMYDGGGEGEGGWLVIITPHNMYIRRDSPQVLERLLVAYVSGAEYLLYLARYQELLEFRGEVVDAVGDVEVANDEDEDHGGRGSGIRRGV